jgi:hypothetical protein
MSTFRQRMTLNSLNDRSVTRLCCEKMTFLVSDWSKSAPPYFAV